MEKQGLKTSIIIPCYNSERTVVETLQSAIDQTSPAHEIIVVDDGSTDGSAAVLAAFARRHSTVRVVSKPNGGLSSARNAGIRAATGDCISPIDADDRLRPDFLEVHTAVMSADPTIGLSFSRLQFTDREGNLLDQKTRVLPHDVTSRDMMLQNAVSATFVARRALYDEAGLYDETMKCGMEDTEWGFRASLTKWRLVGVDRVLWEYRTSPGGLSSRFDKMLEAHAMFLASVRRHAPALAAEMGSESRARMMLYLARRAMVFQCPRSDVARFAWGAVKACPSLLVRDPVRVAAMLGAGLVPGVADLAVRRVAHA